MRECRRSDRGYAAGFRRHVAARYVALGYPSDGIKEVSRSLSGAIMRYALLSFLLIFGVSSLKAQIVPRDNPMTPADPAYADARNFADVLDQSGIKVLAISPSKYNGFFRGVEKAAYYRTDKGIFEVIFFPDATAADKLAVHETRNGNRYLYSFTGLFFYGTASPKNARRHHRFGQADEIYNLRKFVYSGLGRR